jgi:CelD/BcsL family acetyltransferase involved in cellulose biosynthesis
MAQLWELAEGGEVIGVSIELVDAETHYHWLVSFDAERGDLRPGHIIAAAHIRAAIDAGRKHFDFMVGDEPYKYRWGAVDRELPWLVISSSRPRSRAAEFGSRLIDVSRRRGRAQAPPS